jgi:hypothetical protein
MENVPMHPRRSRSLLDLAHMRWPLIALLFVGYGCGPAPKPSTGSGREAPEKGRVTFVQWSDPHVFDAGAARQKEGIEEEPLDNWSALHWAVMQTNRLALEDHRKIDFAVITGDFGLYNVKMDLPDFKYEEAASAHETNCRHDPREGPGTPISMAEATELVARELRALVVKKIYLVPGNNDLCDEDPRNRYRYAEFVLRLKQAIRRQQDERKKNLEDAAKSDVWEKKLNNVKSPSSAISVDPPPSPEIIDLTFTLERLSKAQDPRAIELLKGLKADEQKYLQSTAQTSSGLSKFCGSSNGGNVPEINGFCLLGLDSSYFKPHEDAVSKKKEIQKAADKASADDIDRLNGQIQIGGSYLLFTHVPDIEDPFGRKADPGSSWKLSDPVREKWKGVLQHKELIAVFAGHFHSTSREIYPHNFSYVKQLDMTVAQKFWLSPSLAAKYQAGLPAPKTARGIFLFCVAKKGSGGIAPAGDAEVEATPIWFSPLNQKPPLPAEDKLAEAHALESDGKWDEAALKYQALMGSATLDSTTRSEALAGYAHAREVMDTWWWKSPLSRWVYVHWEATLYTVALLVGLFLAYWLLKTIRFTRFLKWLLVPRFRGKAKLNTTSKITRDAPAEEFAGQMLVASQRIRRLLEDEKEPFMAQHIALLTPSSSSVAALLDSAPKIKGGEEVNAWLKFLYSLMQTFQWNIDTAVAVFPSDALPDPAATPPIIQSGGEVSGYAVLQWGWFVKKSWLRSAPIVDRSAIRDVARTLAELVAGEAFLHGNVRKFTEAESFCLFMEGVRWLQLYDEEANKPGPSQPLLKQRLLQAQKFLRECVTIYPDDLLPHYYLGIIFTYHAQVEQALYFQDLITTGRLTLGALQQLPPREKDYLQRAAEEFAETARRAKGDLQWYALYNQAQALARLDEN